MDSSDSKVERNYVFSFFFTGGELCSKTPEFKIEVAILYADFMP